MIRKKDGEKWTAPEDAITYRKWIASSLKFEDNLTIADLFNNIKKV